MSLAVKTLLRQRRCLGFEKNRHQPMTPEKIVWMKLWGRSRATKARQRKERKMAEAKRLPGWARTPEQRQAIEKIYACCRAMTELTGEAYEVDHAYPLRGKKVSGLHVAENLQVLPAYVNWTKSNKEFLTC